MSFTKITDLTDAVVDDLHRRIDWFGIPKSAWRSENGKYTILLSVTKYTNGSVRSSMVSIAGNTSDTLNMNYRTFYCEPDGSTAFVIAELMELMDRLGRDSLKLKEHVAVFRDRLLNAMCASDVNGPDVVVTGLSGYSSTSIINLLGVSRYKALVKAEDEHGVH